jgi:formylglycine-generating enzyme required for sulfatase activity
MLRIYMFMTLVASAITLVTLAVPAGAVYGVRIGDLEYDPLPANPIKVWGTVTAVDPVRMSDGKQEIGAGGIAADIGDFLIVTGDWDGFTLTPNGPVEALIGPAQIRVVYIPAGSFLMGNNGHEPYTNPDELPQHSVYLSGYWIGKYEVTRGEYHQFMQAGGYTNPAYWSSAGWSWRVSHSRTEPHCWPALTCFHHGPTGCDKTTCSYAFTQTESHPVVGVSYYESEAFCNWAGGHLATEAQWEKAARWNGSAAPPYQPRTYPWGDTWDAEKCNTYYDHNPAGGGYARYQTAPVGSYPTGMSPYGLHDMAGNAWEWVQDWYTSYPGSSSPFDYTGSYRVIRGGSWGNYYVTNYRCASRDYYLHPSSYQWSNLGFRLAR